MILHEAKSALLSTRKLIIWLSVIFFYYKKVFKTLAIYLILSISIVSAQQLRNQSLAIQYPTNLSGTPIIRVLAIGNSFSEDAVEQNLYELAKEAGIELIIGNAYRAGQGFKSHWDDVINNDNTFQYRKIVNGTNKNTMNQSLSSIITNEPWDFITFQQVSQESGLTKTFEPYLGNLIDYVKSLSTNDEVKFGYHMTWAYAQNSIHSGFANYSNNQLMMYEAIVSAVQKALLDHTELSFVIPSGTAIQPDVPATIPTIQAVKGRAMLFIKGKDCTLYSDSALTFMLEDCESFKYTQFVQHEDGHIDTNIITFAGHLPPNDRERVMNLLDQTIGLDNIDLRINEIPETELIYTARGKFSLVVNKRFQQ